MPLSVASLAAPRCPDYRARSTPALERAAQEAARTLGQALAPSTRRWARRWLAGVRAELASRRWTQALWLARASRRRGDARTHVAALAVAAQCRQDLAAFRAIGRVA